MFPQPTTPILPCVFVFGPYSLTPTQYYFQTIPPCDEFAAILYSLETTREERQPKPPRPPESITTDTPPPSIPSIDELPDASFPGFFASSNQTDLGVCVRVCVSDTLWQTRIFDKTDSPEDVRTWISGLPGVRDGEYRLLISPLGKEFPHGSDSTVAIYAPQVILRIVNIQLTGVSRLKKLWGKVRHFLALFSILANPNGDPADFWRDIPQQGSEMN
jgi:hypothetical protein